MLNIENVQIKSPFILAPLAGYTDLAFRLLCREYGAGLCVTEMISCHGLCYKQPKTLNMLKSNKEEKPVSFQLFGADPNSMGEAAAIMNELRPDLIDINMGCPVRKVTKKGAGAALMKDPTLAGKIISSVISNCSVPVTVKIRAGIDASSINAVDFSKMAQDLGVAAITVHGRTWAQGFTGLADRQVIAQVKENLTIPVIGNGDVTSFNDGLDMMQQTGCDGVMIGRGALGNPWVFQESGKPSNLPDVLIGVNRHLLLMEKHLVTDRMLGVIKNHIGRYFKSLPGSSQIRKMVYECATFDQLKDHMSADFLTNFSTGCAKF